ncbi:MAG: PHP domain-containing protein [Chloroflexi bacterium]|jgi:predicted metal-dependent phosphoesterase TrpH|nr:PHP domain-containing protein [Chloroflexota bacterium]
MNTFNANWLRVELHLHTAASADSLVTPQNLVKHCQQVGINRVAITDHNCIKGALAAHALAPELVIVGEEIETTQGELLGYFMTEPIPPGLEPMQVIQRLRDQGALISVSHPFDRIRSAQWTEAQLLAITPHVDAIEIFNARCLSNHPNQQAAAFAQAHGLPGTVGSDAHSLVEVGRATLLMPPFEGAAEFLLALKHAQPQTRLSPAHVHFYSTYAKLVKRLKK